MTTTAQTDYFNGIPVTIPNRVVDCGDFYISYNNYDIAAYGCATTALVVGQMEIFFILKGDHRSAYDQLIKFGFDACFTYFLNHLDQKHKYSDKPCTHFTTRFLNT